MNKNKVLLYLLFLLIVISISSFHHKLETNDKAIAFINSLTEAQKTKSLFPFSDMGRYEFTFLPVYTIPRRGIQLKELDSVQKIKLNELLQEYLSNEGVTKVKNIISLENVLKELEKNDRRDEGVYTISFFGMPGKDSVWSWKFEGHHISLNFTIVRGQVVFAPLFMGSNPAEIKEGPRKGFRALKNEEDEAYALINMFSSSQREKVIFSQQALSEIATFSASETAPLLPAGIFVKEMNNDQKKQLDRLLGVYLSNLPPILAEKRRRKIAKEDINDLRFGWAGSTEPGKAHYYRIQGKNFIIELDNTQNNANHIHSVWRDFYGDFGRDLLMEHYHSTKHPH
jgi:hypothetical protein